MHDVAQPCLRVTIATVIVTIVTAAFNASITARNISGGFRGSGLVPFHPKTVLSNLNVKLRTPTFFSDYEGL